MIARSGAVPRILLVGGTPPPLHGQNQVTQLLLDGLSHETTLHVRHLRTQYSDDLRQLQRASATKFLRLGAYWLQLVWLCLVWRPRVVVVPLAFLPNPFLKDAILYATARLLARRAVIWCHMDFRALQLETRSAWFQWLGHKVMASCEAFVCLTPDQAAAFPAVVQPRIHLIPNAISDPFAEGVPDRSNRSDVRLLFLSNLYNEKGWRETVAAAAFLCRDFPHLHLDLYGAATPDASATEIEAVLTATGFPDRIRWHGPANEAIKRNAFAQADIVCLPTRREAFGLVRVEALAAGLPLVTTAEGSGALFVSNGNGVMVPTGTPEELVAALRPLVADAALRQRMGHASRQLYEQHYEPQAFVWAWTAFLLAQAR